MRDRRADSRFDNIRLRFRSSRTQLVWSEPDRLFLYWSRFSSSEPEPELNVLGSFRLETSEPELGAGFRVSEPELEVTGSWENGGLETAGGSWSRWKRNGVSQGGKPGSKGFPRKESAGKVGGKADNMAGKGGSWRGRGEEGKREELLERREVFMNKTMGSLGGHFGHSTFRLLSHAALLVVDPFWKVIGAYISMWAPTLSLVMKK